METNQYTKYLWFLSRYYRLDGLVLPWGPISLFNYIYNDWEPPMYKETDGIEVLKDGIDFWHTQMNLPVEIVIKTADGALQKPAKKKKCPTWEDIQQRYWPGQKLPRGAIRGFLTRKGEFQTQEEAMRAARNAGKYIRPGKIYLADWNVWYWR